MGNRWGRTLLLAGCAALVLGACGGGGGTSGGDTSVSPSPPPPPPPPPANVAPVMRYTVSDVSPDEGRSFSIDASGSTDADGDTLIITLTQVSGPEPGDVPLGEDAPTGESIFTFRAPEVSEDTVMEFELSVSDGQEMRTETLDITIADIVLQPSVDMLMDTIGVFEDLNNPTSVDFYSRTFQQHEAGLIGVEDTEDGMARRLFRYVNDELNETFGEKIQLSLESSIGGEPAVSRGIYPSIFGAPYFPAVALEQSGKVFVTTADPFYIPWADTGNELVITDILDVPAVCAVDDVWVQGNDYDLIVGTRENGLRIFKKNSTSSAGGALTYEPGPVLVESGAFCSLGVRLFDAQGVITAFDASASSIRIWKWEASDFVEYPSVQIEAPQDAPILVQVNLAYSANGRLMAAFLFTNGEHDGHHQLSFYYNDFDGEGVVQSKTYTWDKGVPTSLAAGLLPTITGPSPEGYFVSLETVPYLILVSQVGHEYLGDSGPVFEDMVYLPAPLWTSEVRLSSSTDLDSSSLVLTQNKAGSVRMVELAPHP